MELGGETWLRLLPRALAEWLFRDGKIAILCSYLALYPMTLMGLPPFEVATSEILIIIIIIMVTNNIVNLLSPN